MNKAKLKYVKYTKQELDQYVRDKNSCITLTNTEMHIGFPPWGFANFQETLTNIISREKIGKYDEKLNGIVLEVLNIKVFGTAYPVHDDDAYNHINIKANFYVFQPRIGAIIKGVVKHISHGHVAVIIYRVFNVSIRFNRTSVRDSLKINQQISFRVKMFDLQGAMPYIEGELIETNIGEKPCIKLDGTKDSLANDGDSGISAEENKKHTHMNLKNESDSSSEESSDNSDSDDNPSLALVNGLFPNVKIKQEKLSDSERKTNSKKTSKSFGMNNESDESSESSESESESSDGISTVNIKREKGALGSSKSIARIKQEKKSSGSSSTSQSSDDEAPMPLHKIKKEKRIGKLTTFIPRPIKAEPESDMESITKCKSMKVKTRKRETSISEHLDSIVDDLLKEPSSKRKNIINQSPTTFLTPVLSSTLKPNTKLTRTENNQLVTPSKIKQEPQSEDESAKRKKIKRTSANSKSLQSMESDLFDSFLR